MDLKAAKKCCLAPEGTPQILLKHCHVCGYLHPRKGPSAAFSQSVFFTRCRSSDLACTSRSRAGAGVHKGWGPVTESEQGYRGDIQAQPNLPQPKQKRSNQTQVTGVTGVKVTENREGQIDTPATNLEGQISKFHTHGYQGDCVFWQACRTDTGRVLPRSSSLSNQKPQFHGLTQRAGMAPQGRLGCSCSHASGIVCLWPAGADLSAPACCRPPAP